MEDIMQNDAAALNFGRFDVAVMREKAEALAVWALCRIKQKSFSLRIPLDSTTKQRPDYKGFFAFIAAASAALYRSLESAGCTVKTGWYPPRYSKPRSVGERLHNSIEPKRQNGQSWTISTRHAHLVWQQMENEARGYLLPL